MSNLLAQNGATLLAQDGVNPLTDEAGTGTVLLGTPHQAPYEADVFSGTDPKADVGQPGNLGIPIGQPGGVA